MDGTSWREQRREASAAHAAALGQRKARETAKARELLSGFVREIQALGVEPEPLQARTASGSGYRTGITGWYLRRNKTVAVDAEGNFYLLGTPSSVKGRLFGVQVEPSDPPLIVGLGARDGESIPLEELLRLRLDRAEGLTDDD